MTKKPKKRRRIDPESARLKVEELIRNFKSELLTEELRPKVLALIPIFHGKMTRSLTPPPSTPTAPWTMRRIKIMPQPVQLSTSADG